MDEVVFFKNVVNRCPTNEIASGKGDSPKRIHHKCSRVCRYIAVNTRAICVADTIVIVNRCTQVIVAALIDYWLRNNDYRNNEVIDNNRATWRFLCYLRNGK